MESFNFIHIILIIFNILLTISISMNQRVINETIARNNSFYDLLVQTMKAKASKKKILKKKVAKKKAVRKKRS